MSPMAALGEIVAISRGIKIMRFDMVQRQIGERGMDEGMS